MRYVFAVIACFILFIVYLSIGAFLGWRNGGGVIPSAIFIVTLIGTWSAITKRGDRK